MNGQAYRTYSRSPTSDFVDGAIETKSYCTGDSRRESTALYQASAERTSETTRNLIENDGSLEDPDCFGVQMIQRAVSHGKYELSPPSQQADIDHQNCMGETAATIVTRHNRASRATLLFAETRHHAASDACAGACVGQAAFAMIEALPPPIALARLQGHAPSPVSRSCASLFYSDIAGFTTLSSSLTACGVARLLDDLFRRFDWLAYLHGVQKVDVVGDAYIAATNFTEEQAGDHAARLARFALDAVRAAAEIPSDPARPDSPGLHIRVGIHSGPVCGAVVGPNAVRYTLIGETAVVAAAMESGG
eukprot:CAMPEP_0172163278 /NCGR_PEP_ID=MMETSP1050-20130122/7180_1 /TAXON_ID=233186 /ORGANISM="Cryptomonas curvata, Strain CCAP979/52" /LENGTH=305 /DNA_ID=CAMNT_0012833445 /DNA_START=51 /DNA_END=964 /DNA_ORIENTATION=+